MTIVATRRRRRLNLIVASLCVITIIVVVIVVLVARRAFAIIVDFVARRAASLYAYGDFSVTHIMHTGNISIWEIRSCIPICVILHTGIAVCIWGSPYANGHGSLKKLHMGIPVRIMKLCAYGD